MEQATVRGHHALQANAVLLRSGFPGRAPVRAIHRGPVISAHRARRTSFEIDRIA